jgi:hypothetical protein
MSTTVNTRRRAVRIKQISALAVTGALALTAAACGGSDVCSSS